ncbi:MvdC/MvdD family ATP grasp protein [Sphaerisporangium sp. NPDC004334]
MILVPTSDGDEHADRVVDLLKTKGVDVTVFDPSAYPVRANLEIVHRETGPARRELRAEGRRIVLDELTAFWYRRPLDPIAHPEIASEPYASHASYVGSYVEQECRVVSESLRDSLACLGVPASRPVIDRAGRKPYQLEQARGLGFELPATLVTTDPEAFLDFYDRYEGRVITKPVHGKRPGAANPQGTSGARPLRGSSVDGRRRVRGRAAFLPGDRPGVRPQAGRTARDRRGDGGLRGSDPFAGQ